MRPSPLCPAPRSWVLLVVAVALLVAGCAPASTAPVPPTSPPLSGAMDFTPAPYQVPVPPDAPWPLFRRDHRNSGRTTIPAAYHQDQPWAFRTGKGIFSTPVVDGEGTIYVGSADRNFYAITGTST